MNKSFKRISVYNFIWGLVVCLPLFIFVVYAIANQGQNIGAKIGMGDILIGFQYVIDSNNIFLQMFVRLYKLFSQNNNFVLGNNFETILLYFSAWLLYVSFFRVCVDLLLVVPRVCDSFLHKLTKDGEK